MRPGMVSSSGVPDECWAGSLRTLRMPARRPDAAVLAGLYEPGAELRTAIRGWSWLVGQAQVAPEILCLACAVRVAQYGQRMSIRAKAQRVPRQVD